MKKLIIVSAALLFVQFCFAQSYFMDELPRFQVRGEMRYDWTPENGFYGNALNLQLKGRICEGLSYDVKHRFNKPAQNRYHFDATDWAYLRFQCTPEVDMKVGKVIYLMGGFEFNTSPLDVYAGSITWMDMPCYMFGVNAAYTLKSGKDQFVLQLCQSPYDFDSGRYSLNFAWNGEHGIWQTAYSANAFECEAGQYALFFAFGNRLKFGKITAYLDFYTRGAMVDTDPFRNSSIVAKLDFSPNQNCNFFLKGSYDQNSGADGFLISNGTKFLQQSAGVEFYPKCCPNVRFHANVCYTDGVRYISDTAYNYTNLISVNCGLSCRLGFGK